MNNQERKGRPQIVNVNGNDHVFFTFSIKTIKCSGICNNINNLYTKLCVTDFAKNIKSAAKVFNLVSGTNETRPIQCHETCKCKYRFNSNVCNNKQRWNDDKWRCEWKELIDKGVCDKEFISNPSNCECKCYKSCDFSEYLDYKNCKHKKSLVNKLVEEYTENIDETKLNEINSTECNSVENKCKQFLHNLHCVILNNFYSQHWNWYLFSLSLLLLKKRCYFC